MKHFPKVILEAIPHNKQRYDTVGDYFKKNKVWNILVSQSNADMEFLVLIHELIEWYLCQKKGVNNKDIDAFDLKFEKERKAGKHSAEAEPGNDMRAPYFEEHAFATIIEKECCKKLGLNWEKYDEFISKL